MLSLPRPHRSSPGPVRDPGHDPARVTTRSVSRRSLGVIVSLFGLPIAAAQDCTTKAGAMQTLDGIRTETTALYKETSSIESNLEEALAQRAKDSKWDAAQVDAFRRSLVESESYQALEKTRAADAENLMKAAALLISAATDADTLTICREALIMRDAGRKLRATLERQYEFLRVKLWGNEAGAVTPPDGEGEQ
jgi:hypothetical protein